VTASRRVVAAGCALAAAAPLLGCQGDTGTIHLSLVTAPGATILDQVSHARLRLSDPETVVEAERTQAGELALDLDIPAAGGSAVITFEGLDDTGQPVVVGRTPPLPISAVDADIVVYAAAPTSLAEAPVPLDPARTAAGVTALSYGALFAGGRDGDGAPVDDVAIYNAYVHDFEEGVPLPAPRADPAVFAGGRGQVYIFGGDDGDGPTGTLWRFDTTVPPAGNFTELADDPALARSGAAAAPLGADRQLVTGDPAIAVDELYGGVTEIEDAPPLGGEPVAFYAGGSLRVLIAGDGTGTNGAVLVRGGAFVDLDAPAAVRRTGHAALLLPSNRIAILGGVTDAGPATSAVVFDPATDGFEVIDDVLATPRAGAAIAVAGDRILVAGGTDASGELVGDAEVIDAGTLDPVAVLPMVVPRSGATAAPLANGQILVAGGTDADGAPVDVLELFTPTMSAAPVSPGG
jgi:hypothetical protein